jgi:hypothetical protein
VSHVFISYKREDRERVVAIADGLRRRGLEVWMDVETPAGESWRQSIAGKLDRAACVLVVWSTASVSPAGEFVHDEASRARERGILLPVRLDPVAPPLGFGELQVLDLAGWRGSTRDRRFQDLVAAAKAMVAGEKRPRPRAPRRRRWAAGLVAAGSVGAAVLGFAADVAGLQEALCQVPGVHAVCRTAGWGGVPSHPEKEMWSARLEGDCQGLRDYLARFPNGAYAAEAARRLDAGSQQPQELWTAQVRRLPMVVRRSLIPLPDEAQAREDAIERGQVEAESLCGGFEGGEFRLLDSQPEPTEWRCGSYGGGFTCGFDGKAVCQLEVRSATMVERCP